MEICRNIKIRILAFMMAFWLAFSVSYNDYQEVKALEWVIPTVAFDTAIKFLLGLLGVSLTSKALHDNVDWNQVQQDCVDFQIQKGNDAVAVGEWWEDVAKGTLNQASSCWSAFKEWVQSMLSSNNDYLSVLDEFLQTGTVAYDNGYTITYPENNLNTLNTNINNASLPEWFDISNFNGVYYTYLSSGYALTVFYYLEPNISYTFNSANMLITGSSSFRYVQISINNRTNSYVASPYYQSSTVGSISMSNSNVQGYASTIDITDSEPSIFDSANENIQDTAITTDTPTSTTIPDTLPLPWDNVSDTAEGVDDAISALQEQVAEGVISLEDYWERVQELINAMAIDTTTDEVLPITQNPDTGENETIQDKVEENISNTAFTLSGLEKVFPFCIPWDIYSFVTLLVAEPQAPVFEFPIYNPANDSTQYITVDLSAWESVAVLVRYIFDFLLIIGLLLLARSLIGAEG